MGQKWKQQTLVAGRTVFRVALPQSLYDNRTVPWHRVINDAHGRLCRTLRRVPECIEIAEEPLPTMAAWKGRRKLDLFREPEGRDIVRVVDGLIDTYAGPFRALSPAEQAITRRQLADDAAALTRWL